MSDNNRNALAGSIVGLVSLIATATFLLIGFTSHVWNPTWLVFVAIPIASTLTDITIKKRGAAGAVTGIVSLLAAAVFFVLGFMYGRWHPGWLVFFAIPIADILMKIFTRTSSDDACDNSESCPK
jgi:hypothetical protein